MAIIFSNGFGIGASNNGGGGGGNNCNPVATFMGTLYYDSNNSLTWNDNTSGYTLYNGGYTSIDDGYANSPVTLPSNFYMNCTGSTALYFSTNGGISFGYGEVGPYLNNFSGNSTTIAGNPGDLWLQNGASLSDGTTQGAYYRITNNSNFMKVELKVFQGHYGDQGTPYSYQMNLFVDAAYQYIEIMIKSNTNNNSIGPDNNPNVGQSPSTTSKVWRSSLGGNNWSYLGQGSVSTSAPAPTQYSNNGSSNNAGLLLYLDGSVNVSGNTILDQSGNGNHFTFNGNNPYTGNTYTFGGSPNFAQSISTTFTNSILNTMSISMWVKFPNLISGTIISKTSGNNNGWALRTTGGSQFNLVKYNIADQYSSGTFSMNNDTWYHIAVIQGGTSLTFMINGVVVSASNSGDSNNFANNSYNVYLTKDTYTNTNDAITFGKLRIWDTFKTSSDILGEFNTEKSFYGY